MNVDDSFSITKLNSEDFIKFEMTLSVNNIELTAEQITLFKRYYNDLCYWNERVNLISRKDTNILERHFIHSLSILKYVKIPLNARCLDIGTGGGFPGLPLKIARPDLDMLLTDSIKKKINITKMFAQHTELTNIECQLINVVDMSKEKKHINHFDYIFARAVMETNKLIEMSLPLLKTTGKIVLLKGGNLTEELETAKKENKELFFEEIEINIIGCEWINNADKKIIIIVK